MITSSPTDEPLGSYFNGRILSDECLIVVSPTKLVLTTSLFWTLIADPRAGKLRFKSSELIPDPWLNHHWSKAARGGGY
jgi:hypothetical protein